MVNISLHSGNKNNPGAKPAEKAAVEPTVITAAKEKPNYEARVGLFVLFAAMLLMWGWGWLKAWSVFHPPQRFTVYFHDVEGLNTNAPVNTNGVRVGLVEKIELKKNLVYCHLKINTEDVRIPEHSQFTIQTLGLVGAKYMEINIPEEALQDATSVDNPAVKTHMLSEADPPQQGDDPVRMELYVNKVASQIGNLDIKGIETKLKGDMDQIHDMATAATSTFKRYGDTAPQLNNVARSLDRVAARADGAVGSANKFFERGTNSLDSIKTLANDWDTTAHRANKILDNPYMSKDLKATAEQARLASENIRNAMQQLNGTIGDKNVRTELQGMLTRIQVSTDNISKSIQTVNKVADDQGLRSDIKEIVTKANSALDKVNGVVDKPMFGADVLKTLTTVRSAAENVDTAAQQINRTMSRPLWKSVLFGGKTKHKKITTEKRADGREIKTKETTEETSGVPASDAATSAPATAPATTSGSTK